MSKLYGAILYFMWEAPVGIVGVVIALIIALAVFGLVHLINL